MSIHPDFKTADAQRLLSASYLTGTKVHKTIIAAAVCVMLADHGDISLKAFKAEQLGALGGNKKAVAAKAHADAIKAGATPEAASEAASEAAKAYLAETKIGDRSIYGYIAKAGLLYREHGETFANRIAGMNKVRNARNVFDLVSAYIWTDIQSNGKVRYPTVDSVDALRAVKAKPDSDATLAKAAKAILSGIAKHGASLKTADLQTVIKAAMRLDIDFAAGIMATLQEEAAAIANDAAKGAMENAGLNTCTPAEEGEEGEEAIAA